VVRIYRHGDHIEIAEVFCRSVHELGSQAYSSAQCEAWSARQPNPSHWKKRCELKRPFVFEKRGQVAAFLELDPDGHIDCAYVHPDFARRGIMTQLVRHAVETAFAMRVPRVYVEASHLIRPLFEKEGFALLGENEVDVNGVLLTNFLMEKRRPS